MINNLRVAIVGAGLMGYWHGHSIQRVGGQVVAIIDPNLLAAQTLAKHHPQARMFSSLEIALNACPVDVVHICTPLDNHAELIERSLKTGCHVLAEKPLTASLSETESLINLADEKGVKLNPVHQFPFQRGFLRMIEQRHLLGEVVRFAYTTCSAGGMNKDATMRRSILLEILPHSTSLLHNFFADKDEGIFDINSWNLVQFTDYDLELSGEYQNTGISIVLSLRGRPTCNELRIVGTDATAYLDLFHGYGLLELGRVSRQAKIIKPFRLGTQILVNASSNFIHRTLRTEPAYPGLRELIKRFYQTIATDIPPPISTTEILTAAHLFEFCKKKFNLHLFGGGFT